MTVTMGTNDEGRTSCCSEQTWSLYLLELILYSINHDGGHQFSEPCCRNHWGVSAQPHTVYGNYVKSGKDVEDEDIHMQHHNCLSWRTKCVCAQAHTHKHTRHSDLTFYCRWRDRICLLEIASNVFSLLWFAGLLCVISKQLFWRQAWQLTVCLPLCQPSLVQVFALPPGFLTGRPPVISHDPYPDFNPPLVLSLFEEVACKMQCKDRLRQFSYI